MGSQATNSIQSLDFTLLTPTYSTPSVTTATTSSSSSSSTATASSYSSHYSIEHDHSATAAKHLYNDAVLGIGVSLGALVLLSLLSCCYFRRKRQARRETGNIRGGGGSKAVQSAGIGGFVGVGSSHRSIGRDDAVSDTDVVLEMPPPSYESVCGRQRIKDLEESGLNTR
jgi:hypothetical protein